MTTEQEKEWKEWIASRPECIREAVAKRDPRKLYRMDTGHIVRIHSYDEPLVPADTPVTCTVLILFKYNPNLLFERRVFGIPLDELIEVPPDAVAEWHL